MRKLFKTSFALLLASSILFASCSSNNNEDEEKTTENSNTSDNQEDLKPIKIDWYINETWFSSPNGNLAHRMIEEATGITINFIVPVGNPIENLTTMIVGNTLPDLVTMGSWHNEINQLSIPEYTYSYQELVELNPNLEKNLNEDVLNWYKMPDGKTYAYPCNSVSQADIDAGLLSNRTFLVRKDIYEGIGSPDMRTPEGFIKALEDAKEMFPQSLNGQPLIPFGVTPFTTTGNTGFEDMLLEFLAIPRELEDGYYPAHLGNPNEEYKNWLKTFRLANEKGLISQDIFIDDRTQIEEKIQQGRYFAMMYQAQDALNPIGLLYANNPESVYIAVDGPSNSNLDPHKLSVPGYSGWEVTMVSKNTKYPERIAKLLEWGHSLEGQKALYFGKEGETYDMVDGEPQIKEEVMKMKNDDMGLFKQKYNVLNEYWMFANSLNTIDWEPDKMPPFDQYDEWKEGKSHFYGLYDNLNPPIDSDESDIGIKIANKWGEVLPQLIQAPSDQEFDRIWADFEDYKNKNGYDKYLSFIRAKVEENKAKVG